MPKTDQWSCSQKKSYSESSNEILPFTADNKSDGPIRKLSIKPSANGSYSYQETPRMQFSFTLLVSPTIGEKLDSRLKYDYENYKAERRSYGPVLEISFDINALKLESTLLMLFHHINSVDAVPFALAQVVFKWYGFDFEDMKKKQLYAIFWGKSKISVSEATQVLEILQALENSKLFFNCMEEFAKRKQFHEAYNLACKGIELTKDTYLDFQAGKLIWDNLAAFKTGSIKSDSSNKPEKKHEKETKVLSESNATQVTGDENSSETAWLKKALTHFLQAWTVFDVTGAQVFVSFCESGNAQGAFNMLSLVGKISVDHISLLKLISLECEAKKMYEQAYRATMMAIQVATGSTLEELHQQAAMLTLKEAHLISDDKTQPKTQENTETKEKTELKDSKDSYDVLLPSETPTLKCITPSETQYAALEKALNHFLLAKTKADKRQMAKTFGALVTSQEGFKKAFELIKGINDPALLISFSEHCVIHGQPLAAYDCIMQGLKATKEVSKLEALSNEMGHLLHTQKDLFSQVEKRKKDLTKASSLEEEKSVFDLSSSEMEEERLKAIYQYLWNGGQAGLDLISHIFSDESENGLVAQKIKFVKAEMGLCLRAVSQRIKTLKAEVNQDVSTANAKNREEVALLSQRLEDGRQEIVALKQRLEAEKQEMIQLKTKDVQQKVDIISRLEQDLSLLQKRFTEKEKELSDDKEEVVRLTQEVQQNIKDLTAREKDKQKLDESNKKLQAEHKDLLEKFEAMKLEFDAMKSKAHLQEDEPKSNTEVNNAHENNDNKATASEAKTDEATDEVKTEVTDTSGSGNVLVFSSRAQEASQSNLQLAANQDSTSQKAKKIKKSKKK